MHVCIVDKNEEAFAYHSAGVGGTGGSSYIDSIIVRDTDTNFAFVTASDRLLDTPVFYL